MLVACHIAQENYPDTDEATDGNGLLHDLSEALPCHGQQGAGSGFYPRLNPTNSSASSLGARIYESVQKRYGVSEPKVFIEKSV